METHGQRQSDARLLIAGLLLFIKHCSGLAPVPHCDDRQVKTSFCTNEDPAEYQPYEPPEPWPVPVGVKFYVNRIFSVNLDEATITMQVFLDSDWTDQRLSVLVPQSRASNRAATVPEDIRNDIWNPRVQIYNAKSEKEVKLSYFRGAPPNKFETGRQSLVTMACNMTYLDDYPFDHYECEFQIINMDGNYRDKVNLTAMREEEIEFLEHDYNFEFTKPESKVLYGDYQSLKVVCKFERNSGGRKKVITFFATTSLVATLSLISFFVPKENVPGRLGVLVTLYLLLINLYKSLSVPSKIGYGYIDHWFILSQVPVLIAIVEYGFILAWGKYCIQVLGLQIWHKHALKIIDLTTFGVNFVYLLVTILAYAYLLFR